LSIGKWIKTIPNTLPHSDFGYNIWGDYYSPGRRTSGTIIVGSTNPSASYSYQAQVHWSFGGSSGDTVTVEENCGSSKLDWRLTGADGSNPTIQVKDTYNYGTQITGLVLFVSYY